MAKGVKAPACQGGRRQLPWPHARAVCRGGTLAAGGMGRFQAMGHWLREKRRVFPGLARGSMSPMAGSDLDDSVSRLRQAPSSWKGYTELCEVTGKSPCSAGTALHSTTANSIYPSWISASCAGAYFCPELSFLAQFQAPLSPLHPLSLYFCFSKLLSFLRLVNTEKDCKQKLLGTVGFKPR